MRTIRTSGNARSYDHTPGYRNTSRYSSRWERPAGELSWAKGSALLVGIALVAIIGSHVL